VVGLRPIASDATSVTLGAHGDPTPLVVLHHRQGAAPVPTRGRLGLYHFALLLPDRSALGRFIAHLAKLGAYAGMSDHLVSEAVYLTDPDGLGIEVYCDRPRAQWTHAERQLAMATEPLDVQSVLAAGGTQPWTGAPAGTVMGHVHLFVSDLSRAEAFYHGGVGFDKVVWSYPGALFMSAGGYHHHLGTNTWAAGALPAAEGDARLLEWAIVLPLEGDADAAAHSIERAAFAVQRQGDAGWIAKDPWGTTVRLGAATQIRASR
jgi:catechol 2,3-dioxygenase